MKLRYETQSCLYLFLLFEFQSDKIINPFEPWAPLWHLGMISTSVNRCYGVGGK